MAPSHDIPPQSTVSFINIPARWTIIVQDCAIIFAMFGSLLYALLFDYKIVLVTHCRVEQFFPSFSSVIGNRFPELFIWRLGMMVLLPLRFFDCWVYHWWATNQQSYYQPASEYKVRVPASSSSPSTTNLEMQPLSSEDTRQQTSHRNTGHSSTSSSSSNTSNTNTNATKGKSHIEYHPQAHISQRYQPVSWGRYLLSLAHSFCLFVEYIGLTMLSFVSSSENFFAHELGFILFLGFSQLHSICNFFLTLSSWKLHGAPFYFQVAKCSCWVINLGAIYGAKYFYTRHNAFCEPNIYSYFGIAEYTLVTTNIIMHSLRIIENDWLGTMSFTFYFPSFKTLSHPANYDIVNEDPVEREWLMSNPDLGPRSRATHPLEQVRLKNNSLTSNSALDYDTDDSDLDDLDNPIDFGSANSSGHYVSR